MAELTPDNWWEVVPGRTNGATGLLKRCADIYGWSRDFAVKVLSAYRDFLECKAAERDCDSNSIEPPLLVYQMWQQHILDTKNYAKDCELLCGQMVHNDPNDYEKEAILSRPQRIMKTQELIFKRKGGTYLDPIIWNFGSQQQPTPTPHGHTINHRAIMEKERGVLLSSASSNKRARRVLGSSAGAGGLSVVDDSSFSKGWGDLPGAAILALENGGGGAAPRHHRPSPPESTNIPLLPEISVVNPAQEAARLSWLLQSSRAWGQMAKAHGEHEIQPGLRGQPAQATRHADLVRCLGTPTSQHQHDSTPVTIRAAGRSLTSSIASLPNTTNQQTQDGWCELQIYKSADVRKIDARVRVKRHEVLRTSLNYYRFRCSWRNGMRLNLHATPESLGMQDTEKIILTPIHYAEVITLNFRDWRGGFLAQAKATMGGSLEEVFQAKALELGVERSQLSFHCQNEPLDDHSKPILFNLDDGDVVDVSFTKK